MAVRNNSFSIKFLFLKINIFFYIISKIQILLYRNKQILSVKKLPKK
jgi:hypothetical protein